MHGEVCNEMHSLHFINASCLWWMYDVRCHGVLKWKAIKGRQKKIRTKTWLVDEFNHFIGFSICRSNHLIRHWVWIKISSVVTDRKKLRDIVWFRNQSQGTQVNRQLKKYWSECNLLLMPLELWHPSSRIKHTIRKYQHWSFFGLNVFH